MVPCRPAGVHGQVRVLWLPDQCKHSHTIQTKKGVDFSSWSLKEMNLTWRTDEKVLVKNTDIKLPGYHHGVHLVIISRFDPF